MVRRILHDQALNANDVQGQIQGQVRPKFSVGPGFIFPGPKSPTPAPTPAPTPVPTAPAITAAIVAAVMAVPMDAVSTTTTTPKERGAKRAQVRKAQVNLSPQDVPEQGAGWVAGWVGIALLAIVLVAAAVAVGAVLRRTFDKGHSSAPGVSFAGCL